ncbi:MAG: corrinoid protein, partial [Syntrophomonas sp.]|nr:corrinoid protein [Syntrophomonas sp.]
PILNPFDARMMDVNRAAAVLMNRDINSSDYIAKYKDYKSGGEILPQAMRHAVCAKCNIPDQLQAPGVDSAKSPQVREIEYDPSLPADMIRKLIKKAVLTGERDSIESLVEQALKEDKIPALEIVNQALIPGIEEAGELYDRKQYFLPQLMMAAESMKRAFALLKPHLAVEAQKEAGVIVIATVEGDIHDIGKNIVAIMLENYGFRLVDLGKDVAAETILAAAQRENADIIGLSALMTTTMPRMQEVIEGVKKMGLRSRVMVGGAVLNQEYADRIGADAYSEDARAAIQSAQKLMSLFKVS